MLKHSFKAAACLMLSLMIFALAGCTGGKNNQVFLKVGNESFYEKELYYNVYYLVGSSYMGIIEYDETADFEKVKAAIDAAEANDEYKDFIQKQKIAFVKHKVCDEKLYAIAQEKGIALTDDEKAKVAEKIETIKNFFVDEETITQIKEQFFPDDSNADKKAKEFLEKYKKFYLSTYGVEKLDDIQAVFEKYAVINKVLEDYKSQIPDDEEYIKDYYNKQVESQKADYEADSSAFDSDYTYGVPICYYPSGLRYVKHILISLPEEALEVVDSYDAQISELESAAVINEETQAQINELKKQREETFNQASATAKVKADEVYAKLKAGGDFEALLKEYGEDPGMTEGSAATDGYLINDGSAMVEEFLNTAMALKKPGDISQPVLSSYGYHIIKYMKEGRSGVVPYEEIRDVILTIAMEGKYKTEQLKYYDRLYNEMIESGQVEIKYDVLKMDEETYNKLHQEILDVAISAE
ncbi:MAG: peptidylprolyl isomerase [Clostridia bacterium]|nr:peptidylprolyl isomerase [Clostridia bacterium]